MAVTVGTIAAMQAAAVAIDKAGTGYNQSDRWSFTSDRMHPTIASLVPNQAGDCSSVCGAIVAMAGYPVNLSVPFYTGTFQSRLEAAGFTSITFRNLAQVRAGDFLLNPANHVQFAYLSGEFFSAHVDENGHASGGLPGDQTGHEVGFGPAYVYHRGWAWILRPPAEANGPTPPTPAPSTHGDKLTVDGILGPNSIRKGQELLHTPADGVISAPKSTWVFAVQDYLNRHGYRGLNGRLAYDGVGLANNATHAVGPYNTVGALQRYLTALGFYHGVIDGVLDAGGSDTVRAYQQAANAGHLFN